MRAGVLEQGTVDLLREIGVGERHGCARVWCTTGSSCVRRERHRIALDELTGGRAITVYGQQEVVKDLIAARLAAGGQLLFEVDDVSVDEHRLRPARRPLPPRRRASTCCDCDVIAGCDGFHGVCRAVDSRRRAARVYEREYPFGWLGILAAGRRPRPRS